jgi:hypothetical protein
MRLATLALVVMVGLDLVHTSTSELGPRVGVTFTAAGATADTLRPLTASRSWIRTAGSALAGELAGASEVRARYSMNHPRLVAAEALQDAAWCLSLMAIMGLVAVIGRLLRVAATFRAGWDLPVHLGVAWLASPLAMVGLVRLTHGRVYDAVFGGAPLLLILAPTIVASVVAVVLLTAGSPRVEQRELEALSRWG